MLLLPFLLMFFQGGCSSSEFHLGHFSVHAEADVSSREKGNKEIKLVWRLFKYLIKYSVLRIQTPLGSIFLSHCLSLPYFNWNKHV